MDQTIFTIISQEQIAQGVMRLSLSGDTSAVSAPGQFVNIRLSGFYLRRPISVFDCEEGRLTLVYKRVGEGTEKLAALPPGEKLDILTGLGNGYDVSSCGERPLLLGGGVGVPPLYLLARKLTAPGVKPFAVLGFNSSKDVFGEAEFRELLGDDLAVVTVDGSYRMSDGRILRGFVTDHIPPYYTYFYTCGPEPMLRAVYDKTSTSGEFSFEERMGCGFGACMGCSHETVSGYKRICKDGPVLKKEEILWRR